jgi:DNA-binding MurR/RpiR family transcriptional regulator
MPNPAIFASLEKHYPSFTPTEKLIADFFLKNKRPGNFTAKNTSRKLHVSEASLSRFAQKMGYHGYREFLYLYEAALEKGDGPANDPRSYEISTNEKKQAPNGRTSSDEVFSTYGNILSKAAAAVDDKRLRKISAMICKAGQVFVYGLGSSGLAATEFELRMLKAGIDIKAVTDYHQMVINETRLKKESLVIGITLSAQTMEIRDALLSAAAKGARTVCVTAGRGKDWFGKLDETLPVSTVKGLEYGNMVSPMLPLLLSLDLLYASCLAMKQMPNGHGVEDESTLWKRLKKLHSLQ